MPWIERIRTEQPLDAGVGIDWGNPTSRSLAFAWDAASKSMELTAGLSAGLDQTSSAVNKNGLAAQCSSGQKNIEWNKQFITTSDGTGGGDFTMLVVADPAATGAGSAEHVFDQKNDAAGAPYAQVGLLAHSGARGAYTSGAFSFFTYRSTDSEVSAAGACDGLEHVWIGVRRAGTLYLYKDGVLLASGAGFNGSLNISQASRYTAVGSAGNATAGAYRNKASMARAWNRALSAAEIAEQTSLARFSLYQPQARIWVPVAAGGDSTITQADGTSTASSLGGSATAATTPAAADGTSTAASIAASATAAAGVTQADGASTAATLVGVASTGSTITQADGSTVASVLAGSATSSAAATQADGVSTVGTLAGSATAASVLSSADGSSSTSTAAGSATSAAALTQADGLSTVSTLTGAGTGIAAFTQADGVSTTGTLTGTGLAAGSSTITPAAGSTTAGAIAGSSTAIAAITQADGTTTAGTLSSSSVSPAVMTAGAGTSTTSTLAGSSIFAAAMTQASGATTASAFAASAVAACVAIAAAGASSAQALAGIPPNTSSLAGIVYEIPEDVRSSTVLADARGFTVLEDVRSTATTI